MNVAGSSALSYIPLFVGIIGALAGLAALARVRSQNRKDDTSSIEEQKKGAYGRLQEFVNTLTVERDYWKQEAMNERVRRETCEESSNSLQEELEILQAKVTHKRRPIKPASKD